MLRFVLVGLLVACTDAPQGVSTRATCPATDPPTYASFATTFFAAYCLECHSQAKMGADRQDAPVTIDFDTRSLVRMNTSDIDKQAAYGPAAKNHLMPLAGHPAPSEAERVELGRYIACEVGN